MLRSERRGEKSCMLLAQKKNQRNLGGVGKEMLLKNTESCINIGNIYVVLLCGILVIHIEGSTSEIAKAI